MYSSSYQKACLSKKGCKSTRPVKKWRSNLVIKNRLWDHLVYIHFGTIVCRDWQMCLTMYCSKTAIHFQHMVVKGKMVQYFHKLSRIVTNRVRIFRMNTIAYTAGLFFLRCCRLTQFDFNQKRTHCTWWMIFKTILIYILCKSKNKITIVLRSAFHRLGFIVSFPLLFVIVEWMAYTKESKFCII